MVKWLSLAQSGSGGGGGSRGILFYLSIIALFLSVAQLLVTYVFCPIIFPPFVLPG